MVAAREGVVEYAHVPEIADIFRTHEQVREMRAHHDRDAMERDAMERDAMERDEKEREPKDAADREIGG